MKNTHDPAWSSRLRTEQRTDGYSKVTLPAHERVSSLAHLTSQPSPHAVAVFPDPSTLRCTGLDLGGAPLLLPFPPPVLEASRMPGERALFVNLLSGTLDHRRGPASSVLPGAHSPLTLTLLISSLLCWQRLCEAGFWAQPRQDLVARLVFLPASESLHNFLWVCISPNAKCESWWWWGFKVLCND